MKFLLNAICVASTAALLLTACITPGEISSLGQTLQAVATRVDGLGTTVEAMGETLEDVTATVEEKQESVADVSVEVDRLELELSEAIKTTEAVAEKVEQRTGSFIGILDSIPVEGQMGIGVILATLLTNYLRDRKRKLRGEPVGNTVLGAKNSPKVSMSPATKEMQEAFERSLSPMQGEFSFAGPPTNEG